MIQYIMIHHTAVSIKTNDDQLKANDDYHKSKWHFESSLGFFLGYNYEISGNGTVRQARADGEVTAACPQDNMNDGRCIHIALDGHFDIERPTPQQIYALRDLLIRLTKEYNIKGENILAHNQYANKSCPGQNFDMEFVRGLIPGYNEKPNIKTKIKRLVEELIELIDKL